VHCFPAPRATVEKETKARREQSSIAPVIDNIVRPSKNIAASPLDNEPATIARQLLAALTVPDICGSCCRAPCIMPGPTTPALNVITVNAETVTGIDI
jgi:hypothetical protein